MIENTIEAEYSINFAKTKKLVEFTLQWKQQFLFCQWGKSL